MKEMSIRPSGILVEDRLGAVADKRRGLKELLNENQLYEDVVE